MFPFYDMYGEIIGYQGRLLDKKVDKDNPKYLNTVFDKSHHLYGIYENKERILDLDFCVITEGVFDVISLSEVDVPAIASIGVNFTEQQAFLLRQLTSRVGCWYDNDKAGNAGKERLIKTAKKYAFDLVWFNTSKYDPNEYLCELGLKELRRLFWI